MVELTETTPVFWYPDDEHGDVIVVRLCPKCGRFLRKGQVLVNVLGLVKLTGWMCKKDGEIQPDWDRV